MNPDFALIDILNVCSNKPWYVVFSHSSGALVARSETLILDDDTQKLCPLNDERDKSWKV